MRILALANPHHKGIASALEFVLSHWLGEYLRHYVLTRWQQILCSVLEQALDRQHKGEQMVFEGRWRPSSGKFVQTCYMKIQTNT
jgi:hypothetical protein